MGEAPVEIEPRPSPWRALRADPTHLAELSVLFALPQLSPHVAHWCRSRRRRPLESAETEARRVLRRAAGVARRGGVVTGSSFYVGMLPAITMIYFEQLTMVLRIAAVYGRDPQSPSRAAEILVLQGRYPTVAEAAEALGSAGRQAPVRRSTSGGRTVAEALGQLPSMIGLRVRRLSARSPLDLLIAVIEIASYFVPVVSIPIWAVANARATRRLGRAAILYYGQSASSAEADAAALFPRPTRRTRRLIIAATVPVALALGVLVTSLVGGTYEHHLRWVAFAIGEASLLLIFARLIRITRIEAVPDLAG